MMKQFKGAIIGFIVGAICATATGAYAAAGDQVQAIFADFNFIINGKSVTLDETPLVYNGTSYLPVRSLSNALGLDVTYKADSRTIVLSKGDSVSGSTYGPSPTPTPIMSTPAPTPSPTTSVVSPSPSSGSVGVTTTTGGDKMDSTIFYNYADVITKLDQLHPNDTTRSYIRMKSNPDGKTVMVYEGTEHIINTSESDYYFDKKTGRMFWTESALLQYLPADVLSGLQKYNVDRSNETLTAVN